MGFIGGGATNYTEFLKFLGDKKLLGSPFQINFLEAPRHEDEEGMKPSDPRVYACNDTDPNYRCSCVDCPAVCPTLEPVSRSVPPEGPPIRGRDSIGPISANGL